MKPISTLEAARGRLQTRLDSLKDKVERNRLGQYATPPGLAQDIVRYGLTLLERSDAIRFLDPAFGTGAFFSALLAAADEGRIVAARGYELDRHYGAPARRLWRPTLLDLQVADFTKQNPPAEPSQKYSFLLCNPPYVRHHHLADSEKARLRQAVAAAAGIQVPGLAGLYCYFLGMAHPWMQPGAIAGWLIPSEFMDVNYGAAVKQYLLERVTLLRIHRFEPKEVQFEDALVSSVVVWLRNEQPPASHTVEFCIGGSLDAPKLSRRVPLAALRDEAKWTRFPTAVAPRTAPRMRLADFFDIKRGIATGNNKFFILTRSDIQARNLPPKYFRPILPSPRYLSGNEILADADGLPILSRQLFLLDCPLSEAAVRRSAPALWAYLESGQATVAQRYLCRSRKVWYFQEVRPPAPLLCTYIGRSGNGIESPFRFILNQSKATAPNVYLLMYPKPPLAQAISDDRSLVRRIWEALNGMSPTAILGEGRFYGGGLHKIEPKELGNVDASALVAVMPKLDYQPRLV